ncbi:MAG: tetratricopeptide repeat protein [Gammaproteobacteria bacterium]|nr:tetratricopeptide repeat protein [Gammaproteobacteria bacterium]
MARTAATGIANYNALMATPEKDLVAGLAEREHALRARLEAVPNDARAWHDLAGIALRLGQPDMAEEYLLRATVCAPAEPGWWDALGAFHEKQGHGDAALQAYQAALALDVLDYRRHFRTGCLLYRASRPAEALPYLRACVAQKPDFATGWRDLGNTCREVSKLDEAVSHLKKSISLDAKDPLAWNGLGLCYKEKNRLSASIEACQKAIDLKPELEIAHNNLGLALHAAGQRSAAIRSYQRAIELKPTYAAALSNLAVLLVERHGFDEAERLCRASLKARPNFAAAHTNMGMVVHVQGRIEEALQHYARSLELAPKDPGCNFNRALGLLQLGRYDVGWDAYEWGFDTKQRARRKFDVREWNGDPSLGYRLVVYTEQGIGDEIMFASLFHDLRNYVGHLVIVCEKRLVPLFERSFPDVAVYPSVMPDLTTEELVSREGVNLQVAMGSVPRFLRREEILFPRADSFLVADPARVVHWEQRLRAEGDELVVGISWQGGKKSRENFERSFPLRNWESLLRTPGVRFVDLQYGDTLEERTRLTEATGLEISHFDEIDPLKDMDEFAALVNAMDLVISVDNSTVHLSGALGIPTLVLMPHISDWRWRHEISTTPWYRSLELLRQPAWDDWQSLLHTCRERLEGSAALASHDVRRLIDCGELDRAERVLRLARDRRSDPDSAALLAEVLRRRAEQLPLLAQHSEERVDSPAGRWLAREKHRLAGLEWEELEGLWQSLLEEARVLLEEAGKDSGDAEVLRVLVHLGASPPEDLETVDGRSAEWHGLAAALCNARGDKQLAQRHWLAADRLPQARMELGMQYLANEEFSAGWELYEARRQAPDWSERIPFPEWDGRPDAQKQLLVWAEQGLGDEILFSSCLRDIAPQLKRCWLECDSRLVALMQRSFPELSVISRAENQELALAAHLPQIDCQLPLASLARLTRPDNKSFPRRRLQLKADAARQRYWRKRLGTQEQPRIGLAWRGGRWPGVARRRSLPVSELAPMLEATGAHWLNLQHGPVGSEWQRIADQVDARVIDHGLDTWHELDELAALLRCLDLVITVDNSIAHLAAALGCETWVLLDRQCDWRWGRARKRSLWYPAARLFRQPQAGDWSAVTEAVALALRKQFA